MNLAPDSLIRRSPSFESFAGRRFSKRSALDRHDGDTDEFGRWADGGLRLSMGTKR